MIRKSIAKGFTVVELVVVIAVLGILVGLTVVGYGAWRERAANTELKSDLSNAVLAMNNERNFNNVYPTSLPSSFKSSEGVTVTYKSGDADSYCIQAVSKVISGLSYYVNSTTQKQPIKGTCAGGPGATSLQPGYSSVVAGGSHTCAILSSNSQAYCWGLNTTGQLGNGSAANSSVPVPVTTSGVLSGKTIKSIFPGAAHTCAIASDNNAYCWGYNINGQLGNNSTTNSSVPVPVTTSGVLSGKTIKSISSGYYHTCAIASDNNAYCWGFNVNGQLGNNSTASFPVPVPVMSSGSLGGKAIKSIVAGLGHTCAIASDDNAYCWGANTSGQLGNNSTTNSSVPVPVTTSGVLSGKTVRLLSGSFSHNCTIASDNRAYCWGYNAVGALGNGSTTNSSVPVAVTTSGALNGKTLTKIDSGAYFSCTFSSDNNSYCWGSNSGGRLGNNSTTDSSVPVAVTTSGALNGKTLSDISLGSNSGYGCIFASDNNAYCWGQNQYGQFGNGSTNDSLVPVRSSDP